MLPDRLKFKPGNLDIPIHSDENNSDCSSPLSIEPISPFENNQSSDNWSNFQYFPEQFAMSDFNGEPNLWTSSYYNLPPYNYYNSSAAPSEQYGLNGSYRIPSHSMSYPLVDETREVSNVNYNTHPRDQYADNDRAYYLQNCGHAECGRCPGYLTNENSDPAYQPYHPSESHQLMELSSLDSSTAEETRSANRKVVTSTTGYQGRPPFLPQSDIVREYPASSVERVFIWDLDETILIFHSLLNGSYASKFQKNMEAVIRLGHGMENLIFELGDKHLFLGDLELYDQVNINDTVSDDNERELSCYDFARDGLAESRQSGGTDLLLKIAYRYRIVKELYNRHRNSVEGLLDSSGREQRLALRSDIEVITDNWLTLAKSCLEHIDARESCINILVTSTQLVPALAKILIFDIGKVFPIENIYSATKIGKKGCFERIISRFGRKKCTYVVIGDGIEEENAAKEMDFPFWRVSSHSDLVALYSALDNGYL